MRSRFNLRDLPPLKALRGFEAATRHQSIRDAAAELCLTPPAINHQLQIIEQALGVRLFAQDGRHVVSTEEGRLFYPYVRAAFESLMEGAEAVRRHALDTPLRVQTYVTASIRWLAPRVPQFLADNPGITLSLTTCAVDWTFDEAHADVGLVYCAETPDPERYHWVPLFDYTLDPVCSPAFLERAGGQMDAAMLMHQPLVANYTEANNWARWFAAAGVAFAGQAPYLMVDTLAVALEMALAGRGVALVNGPFADADLAAGRLVRPVDHTAIAPGGWGLICRQPMKDKLPVRLFIDWVTADVAGGVADSA
ncbi:LysR substrate-binding domain-containing protein [Novosphingobium sp.]|uniref:LysR substrate-binding domain-containing protein n=1 Tax=Novosphingobium sp. TaxID=1874826 RepID=UPI003340C8D8